jgi:hypothetical protein
MFSPAVLAAQERRRRDQAASTARFEWFIDKVMSKTRMTLKKRVTVATQYLRDKIVQNISVPVTNEERTRYFLVEGKDGKKVQKKSTRIVVTERSKEGEFPRADTTLLMKTIFSEVKSQGTDIVDGYIGTPLKYGLILETSLRLKRSFLRRTLNEEIRNIERIIDGPIE